MNPHTVIVGAGQAAGEFALRARQAGYTGRLTLLGAERHLPYARPPLSKAFLAGEVDEAALLLRPANIYADLDIGFAGGVCVTRIDRGAEQVLLADGSTVAYTNLVLATGGHARRLSCPGAELACVFALRTIDDVAGIAANMVAGRHLVLVGGGYVGLEVAAVASKRGLRVSVVEAAPRLLARVTGPEISDFYAALHRQAGVTVRTGASVVALRPKPAQTQAVGFVELDDGSMIQADFVVAGIGLIPNTQLAEAAGLAVGNGILVDTYCRTSDHAVLAIGDCSNHPSRHLGRRIRLESVPNALEQARVAASTLTGTLRPYDAVPWFWSDQYDTKLQAVGLVEDYDQVVLRGETATKSFVVFYLRQGRLVAADAVNRAADFMVAKRLVAEAARPDPDILADDMVKLKNLLTAAPA